MCLTCWMSCVIVVLGILVSCYCIHYDQIEDSRKSENSNKKSQHTTLEDSFILQYEQISAGIISRDNMTIIAGTILITASILLFSSSMGSASLIMKFSIILASLLIYVVWLICFNMTSNKLNNIGYKKLRDMEKDKNYAIDFHTHTFKKVEHEKWWKYLRRKIWLYLFWVLTALGIVILSISI